MTEGIISFLTSWFSNPSVVGIGLAMVFGVICFLPYWTPILRKPWAWTILIGSAFLTLAAIAFIQIPLQVLAGRAMNQVWSLEVLRRRVLVTGIPAILFSGLVQEGAKLVPIVIYWWRMGKNIDPKLGLAIGAVAGVGFGIFEAQWVHNTIFASGWTWAAVQTGGMVALAGFWERFFTVAFHTAASALAGYGLARGRGWQFYLLASFLHTFLNYSALLVPSRLLSIPQVEVFITLVALVVTGGVLWLRWRTPTVSAIPEV